MKRLMIVIGIVLLPVMGSAQATDTSKLLFDQQAASLAEANGFTYKYYEGANGTVLGSVTCTGSAAPFTCAVPFPAFSPGAHTITLTASNLGVESAKSAPFSFTFVVVPSAPVNIRIG